MVQTFRDTNIIGKFSKYTSILQISPGSWKSMPALGECGRLPTATRDYIRFIKYLLKILKMDHDSFPWQCYKEMYKTDKLRTMNWVTKVKRMLFSYGYGCVWLIQSVGDETNF